MELSDAINMRRLNPQICVYLHWWLAKALLCDTLRYEALHKDILNFACLPVV